MEGLAVEVLAFYVPGLKQRVKEKISTETQDTRVGLCGRVLATVDKIRTHYGK